jgi:hypothetical protein
MLYVFLTIFCTTNSSNILLDTNAAFHRTYNVSHFNSRLNHTPLSNKISVRLSALHDIHAVTSEYNLTTVYHIANTTEYLLQSIHNIKNIFFIHELHHNQKQNLLLWQK